MPQPLNELVGGGVHLNEYARPWAVLPEHADHLALLASMLDLRGHVARQEQLHAAVTAGSNTGRDDAAQQDARAGDDEASAATLKDQRVRGELTAGDVDSWQADAELANAARFNARVVAQDGWQSYGYYAAVSDDGLLMINVEGTMMRYASSLDDSTSTVRVRRQLRRARADRSVRGVLLVFNSPGGSIDGLDDLAEDIKSLAAEKPTHARAEDLMASAAVYAASQASVLTCNRTAHVGSIGVYMVIPDFTGMFEQAGIKVHRVRAGEPYKGAGVPGTAIEDVHLAKFQAYVDTSNGFFLSRVSEGRGLPMARVEQLNTGELWIGDDAVKAGLIDHVESFDASVARLRKACDAGDLGRRGRAKTSSSASTEPPTTTPAASAETHPDASSPQEPTMSTTTDAAPTNAATPTTPTTPTTSDDNKATAAEKPATLGELKSAFGDKGPGLEFAVEQYEAGATLTQAKLADRDRLAAENATLKQENATLKQKPAATADDGAKQDDDKPADDGGKAEQPKKPRGVAGVIETGKAPTNAASDAVEAKTELDAEVAKLTARGMSRGKAVAKVFKQRPDLHELIRGADAA